MKSQEVASISTTLAPSAISGSVASDKLGSSGGSTSNDTSGSERLQKEQNQEKMLVLKQRKLDLEKLLSEKNFLLEQIQRQEQQLIAGESLCEVGCPKSSNSLSLRKKANTSSFKIQSNKGMYVTKERSGSVGDMEKKLYQENANLQTQKLPNLDPNLSKSLRNMPYTEYDSGILSGAQQKLLLKRQQQKQLPETNSITDLSNTYNPNYLNNLAVNVGYSKNPSIKLIAHSPNSATNHSQRNSPAPTPGILNSKIVGRHISSASNNSMTERRNSIKSMHQFQTDKCVLPLKQPGHDDRLSLIVSNSGNIGCYTSGSLTMPAKINRSDYDLSSCMVLTPQNASMLGMNKRSVTSPSYEFNSRSFETNTADSKDILCPQNTVVQHLNPSLIGSRVSSLPHGSALPHMARAVNYDTVVALRPSQHGPCQMGEYDDTSHMHQQRLVTGSRESHHLTTGSTSFRSNVNSNPADYQLQMIGLGGYWKAMGNERIWCTVDPGYDIGSPHQNVIRSGKASPSLRITPTKSVSLGNFDVISDITLGKDDSVDKVSISSMNSEGNKSHQREKQWLETSLDGHAIPSKHQQTTSVTNQQGLTNNRNFEIAGAIHNEHSNPLATRLTPSLQSAYSGSIPSQLTPDENPSNQLRPVLNKTARSTPYSTDVYDQQYTHRHRRTTPSKSPIPPSVDNSASVSDTLTINPPIRLLAASTQRSREKLQKDSSSPPISLSACNPCSPTNALNLLQQEFIRIESPKNMTVVQQAVFMPYKEVTKPFEMSDFYKYSTKFRQKDKQLVQLQQQQKQQQQTTNPRSLIDQKYIQQSVEASE